MPTQFPTRRPGRWTDLTRAALAALVLGCSEPAADLPTMSFAEPIRAVERIRAIDFTLEDELGVTYVADLISTQSGYALADTGGWVLLLDRDFTVRARFGGAGSGPRELRLPQDLERVSKGRVAILDSGNNRITVIDGEGQLVTTVPAGEGSLTDFGVISGELQFVAGSYGHQSLLRTLPRGRPSFGRIPGDLWNAIDGEASVPGLGTHLSTGASGRIHHFDEHTNAVLSYTPEGVLERLVLLPLHVQERIREQAAELEDSFGGRAVVGHTWMLGLGTYEDLAVLSGSPPGVDGLALVLDPQGTTATPIVAGPSLPASEFHHVTRVLLEGDRITTVKPDGLRQYRIEWPDRPGRGR